ncbi:MAG: hypothetical protein HYT22_02490 [Candidatus Niyogibacteria bacterium]|nr:hypothetical protein [Candidatus Niyogibacteria bacterium]
MNPLSILGTGAYDALPVIDNGPLLDVLGVPLEKHGWLPDATGITGHRLNFCCATASKLTRETSWDYAFEAARQALQSSGVSPKEIDQICLATCTPRVPHFTADTIALCGALKLRPDVVWSQWDGGCAALANVFREVKAYANGNPNWTALIVATNDVSSFLERNLELYRYRPARKGEKDWARDAWKSPAIFADGAAAAVLGPADDRHFLTTTHCAQDGGETPLVAHDGGGALYPSCAETQSRHIYLMYTRDIALQFPIAMGRVLSNLFHAHNLPPTEVGQLFLHQANFRFVESFADAQQIPMARVPHSVDKIGNLVSASTLDLLNREFRSEEGLPTDKPIAFAVVGAGMVWGGAFFMPASASP